MLAGTVYFYNDKNEIIKEIDVSEYDKMTQDEFNETIEKLNASKVVLNAVYHNHHLGTETILYPKKYDRKKADKG